MIKKIKQFFSKFSIHKSKCYNASCIRDFVYVGLTNPQFCSTICMVEYNVKQFSRKKN